MAAQVLTIIAAASAAADAQAAAEIAMDALRRLGARVAGKEWLAPLACDIFFDDLDSDQADAAARKAFAEHWGAPAIDLVAQPAQERRKRLLFADMESTIIANEMLDELGDLRGVRAEIAAITHRAMNDEIDFAAAVRERVALLEGMPETALAEAGARIRFNPGARELVATMRANGATAVLVSGGFGIYTRRVRAELDFDLDFANELVIEAGRLSGRVAEPIRGREAKLASLKQLAAELGLPLAATLALGDGANDVAMIEAAGLGVAFRAKPAVAARVRRRIDHNDLTALLYVQGYRAEEVVRAA
jgi:phosphoserine phosphatase